MDRAEKHLAQGKGIGGAERVEPRIGGGEESPEEGEVESRYFVPWQR